MTTLVSFRDFLRTGRLGPLHTGMTPGAVARLLGMPSGWIVSEGDRYPCYWSYGRLEISFDDTAAGTSKSPMRFFQIEHASGLSGEAEALQGASKVELVMTLDGLDGRAKPTDVLRVMRSNPATHIRFEYFRDDEDLTVTVSDGCVSSIWTAQFLEANPGGVANMQACARAAEANGCLDSIYAFPPSPLAARASDAVQIPSGDNEAAPPAPSRRIVNPDSARKIALICAPQVYLDILGSFA